MNIIVIMADQLRFDALGCLGNPLAYTPNLDRLNAQSVRFDMCFTQSPACKPARYSLATGQYVHAHGVLKNARDPQGPLCTIAHVLQPLGYRRFHLGHMHWSSLDEDHGYERKITSGMWRETMPPEVIKRHDWESMGTTRRTTAGPSTRTREQYWGYHVAVTAISQIEEAVKANQRFLSWISFHEPHPPFYPPREIYQRIDQSRIRLPEQPPHDGPGPHPYIRKLQKPWNHLTDVERRQMMAGYYGMVTLADEFIGLVLAAVDRLAIRERTAIIFTSDHGEQMGEHGMFMKFNMREASVRVPLLISLPGRAPAVRKELVEHVDLFRTMCDFVGAICPGGVHGRSLVPLLGRDMAPMDWRDAVFSQYGDLYMVRTDEWKLNIYKKLPGELFRIGKDPREFNNVINDAGNSVVVRNLMQKFRSWKRQTRKANVPALGEIENTLA